MLYIVVISENKLPLLWANLICFPIFLNLDLPVPPGLCIIMQVLKFLMERNNISALHGQVVVGTLILQVCDTIISHFAASIAAKILAYDFSLFSTYVTH